MNPVALGDQFWEKQTSLHAALSRHFQEVLGIDGQPEECAVITGI
jgi:hypothetical protein